ncbi:MAG: mechanosensitive ion channel family protein [Balneolia bacterium]|nr:mechanosensitive ion channel family protein [Balneolia bacterium]
MRIPSLTSLRFILLLAFLTAFAGQSYAGTTGFGSDSKTELTTGTQPVQSVSPVSSDTLEVPTPAVNPEPENNENGDDANGEANSEEVESDEEAGEDNELDEEVRELQNLISFPKLFLALIILIATWIVNRVIIKILDNLSERATTYRLFFKRLTPILRITIWSFAIYIVIAGIIEPPIETVIAITASLGIAVGFASQDILRNIFGGIMIILDKPFQVGDKIQVGEHYGEVKSIGIRSCLIETPDDNTVAIPNGELMNRAVSNANSSALDCQVVSEIFIPATADVMLAKDIARRAAFSSPYLYLNKPVVIIALNEIYNRHYMVKLRVKAYVLDIRYEFLFKSDVTEMIVTELNKHGIIPEVFPKEEA